MKLVHNWRFDNIRGDIFGGITAGIVALPLALAFGVQSGAGAVAGLYGAIVLGVFAATFGGTSSQISGPTGPMTVVSALVVLSVIERYGSLQAGMGFMICIFVLAGFIQILFGILQLGAYIRYIPYPVVSGFMTGIGCIIILLQVFPFFGQTSPKKVIEVVRNIAEVIPAINWEATVIAGATIAIIYLFPKITKSVPSQLVALISMTLITAFSGLEVPLIGVIPTSLPEIQLGTIFHVKAEDWTLIIELALTLALLGAIDSLLTSVIADNITKTKHHSNRELVGQGIGNILAGSIGGLPGAGATMRTLVNVNAGGKTPLSGVIHGILLLGVLLGLGAYAQKIPLPVLAGILISVGIGIIDYKGIRDIKSVPRTDAVVMVIVLVMTVFVDLIQAVAAGLILSSILFMKQMSDQLGREVKIFPLKESDTSLPWLDYEIPDAIADKIYVKHLSGPLFFGFAPAFQAMAEKLPDIRVVIFRMKHVPYIDQTGLYAMEEVVLALEKRNIAVAITGLQSQPLRMLQRINVVPGLIPESYIFDQFDDCVKWLSEALKNSTRIEDVFFEELSMTRRNKIPVKYRL
ncbi:MAG: SulP family inorganic anion transporter [Nitrospinaceae bacterium]|jgi:sulfate permease, SulP family|nr:SulP family inorganic anion transporter [Nitrospina sp.]MBT5868965.1 SulP family inorganic anion transporter [Nitrospinaceae bacterium]